MRPAASAALISARIVCGASVMAWRTRIDIAGTSLGGPQPCNLLARHGRYPPERVIDPSGSPGSAGGIWVAVPDMSRSEEHTSELQSREISYAVFCLKKKI